MMPLECRGLQGVKEKTENRSRNEPMMKGNTKRQMAVDVSFKFLLSGKASNGTSTGGKCKKSCWSRSGDSV